LYDGSEEDVALLVDARNDAFGAVDVMIDALVRSSRLAEEETMRKGSTKAWRRLLLCLALLLLSTALGGGCLPTREEALGFARGLCYCLFDARIDALVVALAFTRGTVNQL
jgi:hypothetical protein